MVEGTFKHPLRGLEGFLNLVFTLMNVPLESLTYTCISKRLTAVEVQYCLPNRRAVTTC
ncbi:transposase [Candidatus Enterovibrio escicola]|nr:transposase [Candidatus Enterovibrio escacola]